MCKHYSDRQRSATPWTRLHRNNEGERYCYLIGSVPALIRSTTITLTVGYQSAPARRAIVIQISRRCYGEALAGIDPEVRFHG